MGDSLSSEVSATASKLPVEDLKQLPPNKSSKKRVDAPAERQRVRVDAIPPIELPIAPFRRDLAGWDAWESVDLLLEDALEASLDEANATSDPLRAPLAEIADLVAQLCGPQMRNAVVALDQGVDLPQFNELRPDYEILCEAMSAAHSALADLQQCLHSESRLSSDAQKKSVEDVAACLRALVPFCESATYMRLFNLIQSNRQEFRPPWLKLVPHLELPVPSDGQSQEELQWHAADAASPDQAVLVKENRAGVVKNIRRLLHATRNVGIVGMAGIGKSTVARAVFEQAKVDFDEAVWLPVPQEDADILQLLKAAFYSCNLFRGRVCPFENAQQALEQLAQYLGDAGRSVLLVLDGVWHSSHAAAVAALNFATRTQVGAPDSRLIVTTRQLNTLTYDPFQSDPLLVDELEIVEMPPLSPHHVHKLFDELTEEFKAAACARLIKQCGGNPLALLNVCEIVERCASDDEEKVWALVSEALLRGSNIIRSCEESVEALPPSLRECFISMAAFPEGALVPEADVLHLFATHAPLGLHNPSSLQAAATKLKELVQHSLITVSTDRRGRRAFCMHAVLHRVALQYAQDDPFRSFGVQPQRGKEQDLHTLSYHENAKLEGASPGCRGGRLRACILPHITRSESLASDVWPTLQRLQYLRLGGDVAAFTSPIVRTTSQGGVMALKFLNLSNSRGTDQLLEQLLPAHHLVHLDLSGCHSLTELPGAASALPQLQHLDLNGCNKLKELPEGIGKNAQLTYLDLSGCTNFDLKCLPKGIRDWSQLVHLGLGGFHDMKEMPESTAECSQLQHLDLSECMRLEQLPGDQCVSAVSPEYNKKHDLMTQAPVTHDAS